MMNRKNIKEDLRKLSIEFFKNMAVEDGYVGINAKRPFGSTDFESDILQIIGEHPAENGIWSAEQYDYAQDLYFKYLLPYIQKNNIPDYREWIKKKRKSEDSLEMESQEQENEETQITAGTKHGFWDRLENWLNTPVKLF